MLGGAFTVAVIAVILAEWVLAEEDLGWAAWIAGTLFTVVFALMARRQAQLIDELRAAQAGLADRARVEERNRIARELHDVIGHALTVSQLHVSSARLAVEEDPAEAMASLVEAERLGMQSLREVRHAVGLLREDGDPSATTPLPGAEQLPALVDGFRRAGVDISYEVVGEPVRLPATVAITVYRILQEALTNVARHAAGAATRVRIEVDPAQTVLTVDSTGEAGVNNHGGIGLSTMKERAEVLGGDLAAGPSPSGWRVRAVLPGNSDGASNGASDGAGRL
jgi:signal transduction histidine kinase